MTPRRCLELDLAATVSIVGELGYTVNKQGRPDVPFADERGLVVSLLNRGIAVFQFPSSRASRDIRNEATVRYNGKFAETLVLFPQDTLPPELV